MADRSRDSSRARVGSRFLPLAPCLAALLCLLLGATSSATASEVVDLRIGAHSDFTRVVFELDRPTGYRIERASPSPGVWELVVTLDATSIPRKVQSQKGLIGLVLITPEGSESVARIRLSQDGLSLKEMILANPPRIVLDVLSPERATASATKPATKTASVAKPAAKPEPPKPAAKSPPPAPVETAAAPPPAPAPKPAAKPLPPPTAEQKKLAAGDSADQALPPDMIRLSDPTPPPTEASRLAAAASAEPSDGMATMGRDMQGDPNPPPGARTAPPPAAERVAKRTAMPPVPPSPPAEPDSGIGMGTIGMGLAGLLVLGGAVLYLRRRSAGDDEDDDYDEGVEVGGPIGGSGGDDNPFASLRARDDDQPLLSKSPGADASAGPFDLGELTDDDEKEVEAVDAPLIPDTGITFGESDRRVQGIETAAGATEGLADESPGDEETMRIIREIERRMASLETRLDEAVDARERLERQVAAQTEELRVQRAAIARTQRAVRNMNRPDEEGPTEPALRDNP